MLEEVRTGLTLVCQTTLSVPDDRLDTVNIDPLANVASATLSGTVTDDSPTIRGGGGPCNCETMCEDEAVGNVDEGSLEDDERNTWADWCDTAFWTACGIFPSEVDDPQPTVAFTDGLFSDEVLAETDTVHEELPVLAWRILSDVGVSVIPRFDGLWTGWSVGTNGWMRSRYFPGQYGIRRFILEMGMWICHRVTRNGFGCCIPPVRGV